MHIVNITGTTCVWKHTIEVTILLAVLIGDSVMERYMNVVVTNIHYH